MVTVLKSFSGGSLTKRYEQQAAQQQKEKERQAKRAAQLIPTSNDEPEPGSRQHKKWLKKQAKKEELMGKRQQRKLEKQRQAYYSHFGGKSPLHILPLDVLQVIIDMLQTSALSRTCTHLRDNFKVQFITRSFNTATGADTKIQRTPTNVATLEDVRVLKVYPPPDKWSFPPPADLMPGPYLANLCIEFYKGHWFMDSLKDEGFAKLCGWLHTIVVNSKNLHTFSFTCTWHEVTDLGCLQPVVKELTSHVDVFRSLTLNLTQNTVGDDQIAPLLDAMVANNKLHTFELNLYKCNVTNGLCKDFVETLKKFPSFNKLTFSSGLTSLHDSSLLPMTEMKKLTHVDLHLGDNYGATPLPPLPLTVSTCQCAPHIMMG
eukprot:TRINITY_DN27788_c0_g1_i1.p1 TRINITY_DN27788_c0_g1~~TRINITY_DN27788_c0_g1_i1.p1  ORF type:complete len:374 (-),score=57.35 TRINITY_DN27788_c0_g1_i1:1201-2322(-)